MTVKVSCPEESQPFPPSRQAATIEACFVVHEIIPLEEGGMSTIGQLLDDYLINSSLEGEEVQSITFRFTPEQWEAQKRILSQLR